MIDMDNDALMDEIQDRDLLKKFTANELAEALWLQGNVERLDRRKSVILIIPKP